MNKQTWLTTATMALVLQQYGVAKSTQDEDEAILDRDLEMTYGNRT